MNKIIAVIRREFIERVRTKAFIIGTVLVPVLWIGFGLLPRLLLERETGAQRLVVLDRTQSDVGARIAAALEAVKAGEGDATQFAVEHMAVGSDWESVRDSLVRLTGLSEAPPSAPHGILILDEFSVDSGRASYLGSNVASPRLTNAIEHAIEPVLLAIRLERKQLDSSVVAAAMIRLSLQTTRVTEGHVTGQSGEQTFFLAYFIDMLMYFALLFYGIQVSSAVMEEKTNRIVEILVSSLRPFELLMGKVIGVGAAGLMQMGIWLGTGLFVSTILSRPGPAGAAPTGFQLPEVSLALVAIILICFLLGFFFYASLYAAIGSMCNTQQEAQQTATPVTMLVVAGMILMFGLVNDPNSTLARVVTFIPFFTALVLPVRYALTPLPLPEVLGGILALLLGILGVVWLAGRIYRVGILSYGKKPSLRELWRWVRTD
ncbi:MAG: ABC transporter permease [Gemmatimonadales bacterium]